MTVVDAYRKFRIHQGLQLHQLRVAAVAKYVCDRFSSGGVSASDGKELVDAETVITACLFHDMGNIIKSDLTRFPELCEPEGVEHWQQVKKEFLETYGDNEHDATSAIAREIGLSQKAIYLIDSIGFGKMESIVASDSYELKVVEYGDSRVGPYEVLSIQERYAEARKRYRVRKDNAGGTKGVIAHEDRFKRLAELGAELEQQLMAVSDFKPEDITDAAIAPAVGELKNYKV